MKLFLLPAFVLLSAMVAAQGKTSFSKETGEYAVMLQQLEDRMITISKVQATVDKKPWPSTVEKINESYYMIIKDLKGKSVDIEVSY